MNAFSAASRFRKDLTAELRVTRAAFKIESEGLDENEKALLWAQKCAQTEAMLWEQTRETMRVAWKMQQMMMETRDEVIGAKRVFMITVRPKEGLLLLEDFVRGIQKMLERKVFVHWQASFEQKGVDDESLGTGMHVHVVAECSCAKSLVLQAVVGQCKDGTWACGALSRWVNDGLIEPNCVDVRPCKDPARVVQRYLVDYVSDDGHKEVTMAWDAKWRSMEGLLPLYNSENGMCVPIKSGRHTILGN